MKQLFIDIKTKLSEISELKFINEWNNQFALMESQEIYSFPFPCVFIEFLNDQQIEQLGQGWQLYNPLIVRIHLGLDLYDAQDGSFEQNLDSFDLRELIFKKLNKFEPVGASMFVRISESKDYDHSNVYHYIIDFQTNYIDKTRSEPIEAQETTPPTQLVINPINIE